MSDIFETYGIMSRLLIILIPTVAILVGAIVAYYNSKRDKVKFKK